MNVERLIAFTQALIWQQSLSGEEGAAVALVLAEMRALGFDRVWADENGSAIGVIEGARPGPTLLLDAHCDTVGIAPGSTWARDPFGAEIDGGYLYGRGAADMKGALAAMIHAAAAVDRFCTNAAYSAGVAGVPTIGLGPSAEGDAHVVNERIALGVLHRAAQGYRGLIAAICSAPEEKHV
jgi:acetylornithine deacetylase/succinyl-diaminopimelate desuccinylase-like protein